MCDTGQPTLKVKGLAQRKDIYKKEKLKKAQCKKTLKKKQYINNQKITK